MYAGKVVETGTKWEIFKNPQHPYTKGLLRSVPRLDQKKDEALVPIYGMPPDLIKPPAGCSFCARCDEAMRVCVDNDPALLAVEGSDSHASACWLSHSYAKREVSL
ncbi:Oligopeptide transport ATP-binding protein OppD [compost metagenome]